MIFGEPPTTQFDLHFSCLGVPVRVSPYFWLTGLIMYGAGGDLAGEDAALLILLWLIAVFVSILVHELGHALTAKYFGAPSRITLGAMGGLASNVGGFDWKKDLLVIAAGPGAGAALAAFVVVIWTATGNPLAVYFGPPWGVMFYAQNLLRPYLAVLANDLLWINVFWTVMNLMPVYPLDGGQITQRLLVRFRPWDGLRLSWQVGMVAGAAIALYGLANGDTWIGLLFGVLAYGCYMQMRGPWSRGPW